MTVPGAAAGDVVDISVHPEPPRPPRRQRRALTAAGLALALLVAGLFVADDRRRGSELDRLLTRVETAEGTVAASRSGLSAITEYQAALLARTDTMPSVRAALLANLSTEARRWEQGLRRDRDAVAAVDVLAWHGSLRTARRAYLARIDAWRDRLRDAYEDPEGLLQSRPELVRLRRRAAEALRSAAAGIDAGALDRATRALPG